MTEAGPPLAGGHQIAIQDAKARLSETGGYESSISRRAWSSASTSSSLPSRPPAAA